MIQSMINWAAGKVPADTDAGVWFVSLHTGDPGDDGQTANEAVGVGYARVAVVAADFTPATDATPSVLANANPITFPLAGGDWSGAADMTHFGLWNHVSGSTEAQYIGRGKLTTDAPVLDGQQPNYPAAALRMTGSETA